MIMLLALASLATSTAAVPQVPAEDTATLSYEVAGVRVIHRPLAANELVAVNLYLLGGARQVDARSAGIEPMLLRVSEQGTRSYPGREARLALARTGSRIVLAVEPDWTLFGFRGLLSEFDSTWAVFADRLMHPTLDSGAVEVVRGRMLRGVRHGGGHPDAIARRLADSLAFAGHPYANDPAGTEASLRQIDRAALRNYHATQMVTSRMLLVVVGNLSRAQLEAAIGRTLGQLPRGGYAWTLPPEWPASKPGLAVHSRQIPTNYIRGYFAGPQANSKDYPAFRIATLLLGGLANHQIRSNGLSYAAGAPFLERGAAGGGVYVSTVRPDTAMKLFNSAITLLRDVTVDRATLQKYFDGFVTDFYSENESNAGQADFLARYELLRGDWRHSAHYLAELKSIQGIHVRRVARQYLKNIQYVYVGNVNQVPEREMRKF